jgi:hypothetical protein
VEESIKIQCHMSHARRITISAAWGPSNPRKRLFSHGRSCLPVRDICGQVFLLVLPHTIGVRYPTAGSSRLKKHVSVIKDVGSTHAKYVEQS